MNRRMPNGMYGGVRGERKSPLLDYVVIRVAIFSKKLSILSSTAILSLLKVCMDTFFMTKGVFHPPLFCAYFSGILSIAITEVFIWRNFCALLPDLQFPGAFILSIL